MGRGGLYGDSSLRYAVDSKRLIRRIHGGEVYPAAAGRVSEARMPTNVVIRPPSVRPFRLNPKWLAPLFQGPGASTTQTRHPDSKRQRPARIKTKAIAQARELKASTPMRVPSVCGIIASSAYQVAADRWGRFTW